MSTTPSRRSMCHRSEPESRSMAAATITGTAATASIGSRNGASAAASADETAAITTTAVAGRRGRRRRSAPMWFRRTLSCSAVPAGVAAATRGA